MARWLDLSGAPPLIVPKRLLHLWLGTIDPSTGEHLDLDMETPKTDYDRACLAAWPGKGTLHIGDAQALALYSEFDEHTWDASRKMVACGGWLPADSELHGAAWSDAFEFEARDGDLVLINSASTGNESLRNEELLEVSLLPGTYLIEYVDLEASRVGIFHRFTLLASANGAA